MDSAPGADGVPEKSPPTDADARATTGAAEAGLPADEAAGSPPDGTDDRSASISAVAAGTAPTQAFADIVIPPRPPLPPSVIAPATGTVGEDLDAARSAPDTDVADGSSVQGDAAPSAPDTDVADGSSVRSDAAPVEEAPVEEAPSAEPADDVPTDPTPADVAVEEPATVPAPEASVGDGSTPIATAGGTPTDDRAEVGVVTATPLETSGVDDAEALNRADDVAAADHADRAETPDRADDGERGGSEEPIVGHVEAAVLADGEDPTRPDVRVDDEAVSAQTHIFTADERADAAAAEERADDEPVGAQTDAVPAEERADDEPVGAQTDAVPTEEEADAQPAGEREHVASAATAAVAAAGSSVTDAPEDEGTGDASVDAAVPALTLRHITKTFGDLRAVDTIDLTVPAGSFYGLVGPNGAGKTTTLSIIAGLLRADAGEVTINGVDASKRAREAKKLIGVLPDRLRTFDRLTGRQLLSYYGALRGVPGGLVESRTADLARAFDLVDALARPVSDYSAGMTKKVMLAGAMIHSPRLLVLDEPFEAVDPVSSGVILDILHTYVDHGGTVILSSHGMELVERVCSRVAVIVSGQVLAEGTVDEVRGEGSLEERFRELSGGLGDVEGLEWLHTFSA